MANYYTKARSNYFRVKDVEALKEWAKYEFEVYEHSDNKDMFMLIRNDDAMFNGDGIITCRFFDEDDYIEQCEEFNESIEDIKQELNVDDNGYYEVNFVKELAEHLADDEVAVFYEIGHEKMRYLTGFSIAVNNKGETRTINLNSIYDVAKELGSNITKAVY